MTYQEFLVELEKTPRDWALYELGFIGNNKFGIRRRDNDGNYQCPISACGNDHLDHACDVAARIGIPDSDAGRIIIAADGDGETEIRADLLRACGIQAQL